MLDIWIDVCVRISYPILKLILRIIFLHLFQIFVNAVRLRNWRQVQNSWNNCPTRWHKMCAIKRKTVWYLRFSGRSERSCWAWHDAVLKYVTPKSEETTASVFRVQDSSCNLFRHVVTYLPNYNAPPTSQKTVSLTLDFTACSEIKSWYWHKFWTFKCSVLLPRYSTKL
jgi:hypothetical protein